MIDALDILRSFARTAPPSGSIPRVGWDEDHAASAGRGVVVGLLDTGVDPTIPDFDGAHLVLRDFVGQDDPDPISLEHGTYSAALLVGRGRFRGLVTEATLLVGRVVGPRGFAPPAAVVSALGWLLDAGAQVIALPLGDSVERPDIAASLDDAAQRGVRCFAAGGDRHPAPILFPASHPAVVAVGAADPSGRLLPRASRSPRLDLLAPGADIPAPTGPRGVERRSGSSVACVVAAGAAALALSSQTKVV